MDRLEQIKILKNEIDEIKDQIRIGLNNESWKHVDDCISELKEKCMEINCLHSFDEEAAQLVGGDF
ncbi:hypothetical protein VSU16_04565 [Cetobacterium somerae]|uniref:hypothetical protein n=1 Tax=Cetobacterium somerae TaxID=188913 RepID=UPI002E7B2ED1|nr:hypothetical protein [Cetobacterium somerae]WVJ02017.1 hypothetical protein VSU16_04565 [Cetobacterium somerae]